MIPEQALKFQTYILRFFKHYGRHDLPWRQNYDPYHILVSEMMLQQTQVERVIHKFKAFLAAFPTLPDLAQARPAEVIRQWQGLGYNRRGLNLHKAAQKVITEYGGQIPQTTPELLSLPGIGPYTAAAIQAFAFNQPSAVIETNIRTVFIFHFFHGTYKIDDDELLPLINQTLDHQNPRMWYSALMDYGTYLKQVVPNPTRQSRSYAKQTRFEGSNRKTRGEILKLLTENHEVSYAQFQQKLVLADEKLELALKQLTDEGFIRQLHQTYRLVD